MVFFLCQQIPGNFIPKPQTWKRFVSIFFHCKHKNSKHLHIYVSGSKSLSSLREIRETFYRQLSVTLHPSVRQIREYSETWKSWSFRLFFKIDNFSLDHIIDRKILNWWHHRGSWKIVPPRGIKIIWCISASIQFHSELYFCFNRNVFQFNFISDSPS